MYCRGLLVVVACMLALPWANAAEPFVERDLVYSEVDGEKLALDFSRPQADGPFPVIVMIHGGGWRGGSRKDFADAQRMLAGAGFAVASIQYRLTPKHQHPKQLTDIRAALTHLSQAEAKYRIDPNRVGVIGASAGGHLALLAGLSRPVQDGDAAWRVRAIVNIFGPTDLRNFQSTPAGDAALKAASGRDSYGLLEDLTGSRDRQSAAYAEASPITYVNQESPPVLTIHGTVDDLVPFNQAEKLHAALREAKVEEKLIPIEGGNHNLGEWPPEELAEALGEMRLFFAKKLRG